MDIRKIKLENIVEEFIKKEGKMYEKILFYI